MSELPQLCQARVWHGMPAWVRDRGERYLWGPLSPLVSAFRPLILHFCVLFQFFCPFPAVSFFFRFLYSASFVSPRCPFCKLARLLGHRCLPMIVCVRTLTRLFSISAFSISFFPRCLLCFSARLPGHRLLPMTALRACLTRLLSAFPLMPLSFFQFPYSRSKSSSSFQL